jgi:4-hydroxybenzoate polyprenyltransferase
MFIHDYRNALSMPVVYWLVIGVILLSSLLYYGLLPRSLFRLNLRNTGWLKAFVIGFVWAGCVSLVPLVVLQMEGTKETVDPILAAGLFIKNWMFCTVNAIMFDLKDYEDDSNKQLKTFAVRFGIHRTISAVIIPLSVVGALSVFGFAWYRHFGLIPVFINLIPFILLLLVSYSMHRPRSIFYYLIVIDGLVLVKALCGILAMQFIHI